MIFTYRKKFCYDSDVLRGERRYGRINVRHSGQWLYTDRGFGYAFGVRGDAAGGRLYVRGLLVRG